MDNPKFSVIVLHYNQFHFIKQSVLSVLNQNYPNIELIIADDCSDDFDEQSINAYIEKYKKGNITNYKILTSSENIGTVKNVNKAIANCSGEYILFFAADDALYDCDTIGNFAASLKELPQDHYVVTAQCAMYDEDLNEILHNHVDEIMGRELNKCSAQEQFKAFTLGCNYAIGATAFKTGLFEIVGNFDEKYKIIEDWSFYLKITRLGHKIIYRNFIGLKHRDGGVSHYGRTFIPSFVALYKKDILAIQEDEIIPYLSQFGMLDKIKIIDKYFAERKEVTIQIGRTKRPSKLKIVMENKIVFIRRFISLLLVKNTRLLNGSVKAILLSLSAMALTKFLTTSNLTGHKFIDFLIRIVEISSNLLFPLSVISCVLLLLLLVIHQLYKWRKY